MSTAGIDPETYKQAVEAAYARGHVQGMRDMSDLLATGSETEQSRAALLAAAEAAGRGVLAHAADVSPPELAPVLRALAGLLPGR